MLFICKVRLSASSIQTLVDIINLAPRLIRGPAWSQVWYLTTKRVGVPSSFPSPPDTPLCATSLSQWLMGQNHVSAHGFPTSPRNFFHASTPTKKFKFLRLVVEFPCISWQYTITGIGKESRILPIFWKQCIYGLWTRARFAQLEGFLHIRLSLWDCVPMRRQTPLCAT